MGNWRNKEQRSNFITVELNHHKIDLGYYSFLLVNYSNEIKADCQQTKTCYETLERL